MYQTNYLKIVWIVAFVALAIFSCWATTESLYMSSGWPLVLCWVISICIYIIAALGTKMIVDSLNMNISMDGRRSHLLWGIVIVIVFWIGFSFPTNTHTFFYRSVINDMVLTDVAKTRGYLGQIKNNESKEAQAKQKIIELDNEVNAGLMDLKTEIMNELNPGDGPKSQEIRQRIADILHVGKIDKITYKGTSQKDREVLYGLYREKILAITKERAEELVRNILEPNKDEIKAVTNIDKNLSSMKKYIDEGKISLNSRNDVMGPNGVCSKLNEGYNAIKKNQDFVNFSSKSDKACYTAEKPVTEIRRLMSVSEVWKDFIHGKYAGFDFGYWIILSILVDIAAFIFFDLAFRRTN